MSMSLTEKDIAREIAKARLEEARWWLEHLKGNGEEVLASEFEHIAELEREAKQ